MADNSRSRPIYANPLNTNKSNQQNEAVNGNAAPHPSADSSLTATFTRDSAGGHCGFTYEENIMAYFAIALTGSPKVDDFAIYSNYSKLYRKFDDVVLKLRMHDENKIHTYAFQLKHCLENVKDDKIYADNFSTKCNKKVALLPYIKAGIELLEGNPHSDMKFILFTNRKCAFKHNTKVFTKIHENSPEIELKVAGERTEDPVFKALQSGDHDPYIFRLQNLPHKKLPKIYQKFFERFYLFCCQKNWKGIEKVLSKTLPCFQEWDKFIRFVAKWNLREGQKPPLRREVVIFKLIQFSFPINLPELSEKFKSKQNAKFIIEKMLKNFDITILDKKSSQIEDYEKSLIDECRNDPEYDRIREEFYLTDDDAKSRGILLWYAGKMPLIINLMAKQDRQTLNLLKLLGKDHQKQFILVPSKAIAESLHEDTILKENTILRNLSNLKDNELNVHNLVIKFDENHSCALKDLVANDSELEEQFSVTNLIQAYFLKNFEENNCAPFVSFIGPEAETKLLTNQTLSTLPENELCIISCNGHGTMFQKLTKEFSSMVNIDLHEHFTGDISESHDKVHYLEIPFSEIPEKDRNCSVEDFRHYRFFKEIKRRDSRLNDAEHVSRINLLCAHMSTTSKRTMMNYFKECTNERIWPIEISFYSHHKMLKEQKDTVISRLITYNYKEDMTKRFVNVIRNRKKILIFWTDLEDLETLKGDWENFKEKLAFFQENAYSQWLCPINVSCRRLLKKELQSDAYFSEDYCDQCCRT